MSRPARPSVDDRLLGANIANIANIEPQRPALTFGHRNWTYTQLDHAVGVVAAGLANAGVTRGDVVLMAGTARPETLFTLLGLARLGAVAAPLNPSSTNIEIQAHAAAINPTLTVGGADFLDRAQPVGPRLSWDADGPDVGLLRPDAELHPINTWGGALDDAAILAQTSGTSGQPKGVLLSHGNLHWGARNALEALDITAADRVLITTPLAHVAAFGGIAQCAWIVGGGVVLAPRFDPESFLDAVHEHGVTVTFVVPAMLARLIRSPRWATIADSALKRLLVGGAPPIESLTRAVLKTGVGVINSYGLTEASGGVTYAQPDAVSKHPLSAGSPVAHIELQIRDDQGRNAEPGVPGQIWLRGPSTASEYIRPDGTRSPATDETGWLHTGDRGLLDRAGRLFVSGRMTDTIITGGENVDPYEVEDALSTLAGVRDVAVIGLPDPEWGEIVTAVIVAEPGKALSLDAVRKHLESRLSRHKVPRKLTLVDALPRTATGKLRRSELLKTARKL